MSGATALDDGLPMVGEDRGNRGLWIGLGSIVLGGLLLFALMEANRQASSKPQIAPPQDYAYATQPRPELMIPEGTGFGGPVGQPLRSPVALQPQPPLPPVRLTRVRTPAASPPLVQQPPPPAYVPPQPLQPTAPDPGRSAPAVVFDGAQAPPVASPTTAAGTTGTTTSLQAAKAFAIAGVDRTFIVSQGTLVFAVLETALDSTQSGQVRAMISTNVYNAQGTQMLIPKGSRIFGEYKGELAAGQNRAQIVWTRLMRPDGATISLDSPASDQLGRAGVKGRVNTHFGERLLGALLQSSIDFGVLAASRAVTDNNGVVIAIPAAQAATSQLIPPAPKPTLKVRHGTRITVFVARDLDFSGVQ
jgi:type IV secretion system protein VirB10